MGCGPPFYLYLYVSMIYQSQIEAFIYNLIAPPMENLGYDIARIRLLQSGGKKLLQIMMDKLDGEQINISDCEKASHYISTLLDVEDPIKFEYSLEVSSTGFDRPITREKDFVNAIGKFVKIAAKMPIDGQKRFSGKIASVADSNISLELKDVEKVVSIPFSNIFEATLDYFAGIDSSNKKQPKRKKK